MQDTFAYCTELVRSADRDRYIASLFAPAELRGALQALYAFNIEVARVREAVREPLPGEIRLQWWAEVIAGERNEEARANPVASALTATIERHGLPRAKLAALVEAHRFDLYAEPMARIADLEAYAGRTASALFALAGHVLAADEIAAVSEPAGLAYAIAVLMRAFPVHAARGQLYFPAELLDRHAVPLHDVYGGRSSPGLVAAFGELRGLARRNLSAVNERILSMPHAALPALLPLATVGVLLKRLDRCDPFAPADVAPWRRQWLIWRAARNPRRIAV